MPHATRTLLSILFLVTIATAGTAGGPTATRGPVKNPDGKVLDEKGIILENAYLRAAITTNKYAGQVMELKYKPTGHELGAITPQGYCMDRSGEERAMFARSGKDYTGRIVQQTDAQAVAAKLGLSKAPMPLALAGGTLLQSARLRASLTKECARCGLEVRPVREVPEPVLGAVRLAQGEAAL